MKVNIDYLTEAELIELNHKIVERLRIMHQVRAHKEMFEFKIGDRVKFHPSGHEEQIGTLTRFNRKTVTVITDNGGHWNVAPSLIEIVLSCEEEKADVTPQMKLLK
ncbi:MAG: hypothetical protein COS89_03650 [Deltaproteobacteria bacterium CG07_land_8_20_14_0_80_38_7]|nr:MAG: hypothetical protein COS89_03650 [Deltaproteobacteria bacterium CG07_land_8_20_14_0_80_38_7]